MGIGRPPPFRMVLGAEFDVERADAIKFDATRLRHVGFGGWSSRARIALSKGGGETKLHLFRLVTCPNPCAN